MTVFYFIRHGEADYQPVDNRNFIGHGRDLAPLTERGRQQLIDTAKDMRLYDCDLIISSPYSRALQSAAILSKELQLDIDIEIDLHEWLPDTSFQYRSSGEAIELREDFDRYGGIYPINVTKRWESTISMKTRMLNALRKYSSYNKVIVVSHGMVIRAVTETNEYISNGQIIEYVYR